MAIFTHQRRPRHSASRAELASNRERPWKKSEIQYEVLWESTKKLEKGEDSFFFGRVQHQQKSDSMKMYEVENMIA